MLSQLSLTEPLSLAYTIVIGLTSPVDSDGLSHAYKLY